MAIQLDLFDDVFREEDIFLQQLEKLEHDISKMRKSFFVRLDAHEKKYQSIKNKIENIKNKVD